MKDLLLFFTSALLVAHAAFAQNPSTVPEIISRGFDAYLKDGPQSAMGVWLKASPSENDPNLRNVVDRGLGSAESFYGRFSGWELIRLVKLSDSVRRVYVVARYERGPLFMVFDCYQTAAAWTVQGIELNAKPSLLLPPNLLGGE